MIGLAWRQKSSQEAGYITCLTCRLVYGFAPGIYVKSNITTIIFPIIGKQERGHFFKPYCRMCKQFLTNKKETK